VLDGGGPDDAGIPADSWSGLGLLTPSCCGSSSCRSSPPRKRLPSRGGGNPRSRAGIAPAEFVFELVDAGRGELEQGGHVARREVLALRQLTDGIAEYPGGLLLGPLEALSDPDRPPHTRASGRRKVDDRAQLHPPCAIEPKRQRLADPVHGLGDRTTLGVHTRDGRYRRDPPATFVTLELYLIRRTHLTPRHGSRSRWVFDSNPAPRSSPAWIGSVVWHVPHLTITCDPRRRTSWQPNCLRGARRSSRPVMMPSLSESVQSTGH